jgi:hypothetical protein
MKHITLTIIILLCTFSTTLLSRNTYSGIKVQVLKQQYKSKKLLKTEVENGELVISSQWDLVEKLVLVKINKNLEDVLSVKISSNKTNNTVLKKQNFYPKWEKNNTYSLPLFPWLNDYDGDYLIEIYQNDIKLLEFNYEIEMLASEPN